MKKIFKISLASLLFGAVFAGLWVGSSAGQPPYYHQHSFSSYNEFHAALTVPESESFKEIREEIDRDGEDYKNLMKAFETGKIRPVIPCWNEKEAPLRQSEKGSPITLYAKELYGLPCTLYHCVMDGDKLLRVLYLKPTGIEYGKDDTYADIALKISPTAVTPDHFNAEYYADVYEETYVLGNGKEVVAILQVEKDGPYEWVSFLYEDFLFEMRGEKGFSTAEFWEKVSFKRAFGLPYLLCIAAGIGAVVAGGIAAILLIRKKKKA